jgi:uncharacterized Tic20 family protein
MKCEILLVLLPFVQILNPINKTNTKNKKFDSIKQQTQSVVEFTILSFSGKNIEFGD